jgi:hypothetical protein
MSVRSFRPVFMVGGVAAAALSCYLVSLRVASERAALEAVETEIVLAQRDIRLLQTEIGTRGRLAQLERWNVKVLALSAPSADQFIPDSFQLASLVAPQPKPAVEAPVVYASATVPPDAATLPPAQQQERASAPGGTLLHEASLKLPEPGSTAKNVPAPKASAKSPPAVNAGTKQASATAAASKPVKLASSDPLAPLASPKKSASPSKPAPVPSRDSGKTR